MMNGSLNLEIVTPDKVIFSGGIISVDIPGESGRFTILSHHAPIIAGLKEGPIKVLSEYNKSYIFDCKSGLVECLNNHVTILVES